MFHHHSASSSPMVGMASTAGRGGRYLGDPAILGARHRTGNPDPARDDVIGDHWKPAGDQRQARPGSELSHGRVVGFDRRVEVIGRHPDRRRRIRLVRTTRAAGAPELTVGFYGSAGNDLLADALRAFGGRHPSYSVSVRELPFGSIDAILSGEVNVAFTRLNPGQTELEVEVIAQEPRLVALAVAHPLAARKALTFAELADESFITNPAVADHGARPPRWLAEQRQDGLPGRVATQSAGVMEILTLVAAGHGVCLVPCAVAHHYARDDIAYVPMEDAEPAVVSLAWREGAVAPALAAFIESVRELAARPSGEPQA